MDFGLTLQFEKDYWDPMNYFVYDESLDPKPWELGADYLIESTPKSYDPYDIDIFREADDKGFVDKVKEVGRSMKLGLANVIDWISKWCKKIVDWFRNIFRGKDPKSAAQIMTELGVVKKKGEDYYDKSGKKIVIPSSTDSTVKPLAITDVSQLTSKIQAGINKDLDSVTVTWNDVVFSDIFPAFQGAMKSNGSYGALSRLILSLKNEDCCAAAVYWITNQDGCHKILDDEMQRVQQMILLGKKARSSPQNRSTYGPAWQRSGTKSVDNRNRIATISQKSFKFYQQHPRGFSIKMSEIIDFQKRIAGYTKIINEVDSDSAYENTLSKDFVQYITILFQVIQKGLNSLTGAFKGIYTIPAQYCNSIRTLDVLDAFAGKMITSGFPSKYITFNLYMASHGDLKGKGDTLAPVWGQSRCVFFPERDKNVVYKIAVNPSGIRANRVEQTTWEKVKNHQDASWFAPVLAVEKASCVLTMKRCDTDKHGFVHKSIVTNECRLKLQQICDDCGANAVMDIHPMNIGWDNGHYCVIDYGAMDTLVDNAIRIKKQKGG